MMQESQSQEEVYGATEKPPTIEQILQLHQIGILSKAESRKLVSKYFPTDAKPVQHKHNDGYRTPKREIKREPAKRKRSPTVIDIEEEINARVRPLGHYQCSARPTKTTIKRPNRASPETAKIRRISKDLTRQRFLKQCMQVDSPLWRSTATGQRHMNKILFARAAQKPVATLYKSYPETLHGVPGRKVMNIMQWQVRYMHSMFVFDYFIYIIIINA